MKLGGRASALDADARKWLVTVLKRPATEFGFDSEQWSNAKLGTSVEQRCCVRYSRVYVCEIAQQPELGHRLLKRRLASRSLQLRLALSANYLGERSHGSEFVAWLESNTKPSALLFQLAKEARVVLLPGLGFGTRRRYGRISLANLNEADYRKSGAPFELFWTTGQNAGAPVDRPQLLLGADPRNEWARTVCRGRRCAFSTRRPKGSTMRWIVIGEMRIVTSSAERQAQGPRIHRSRLYDRGHVGVGLGRSGITRVQVERGSARAISGTQALVRDDQRAGAVERARAMKKKHAFKAVNNDGTKSALFPSNYPKTA